jgi:hypothetical protein
VCQVPGDPTAAKPPKYYVVSEFDRPPEEEDITVAMGGSVDLPPKFTNAGQRLTAFPSFRISQVRGGAGGADLGHHGRDQDP